MMQPIQNINLSFRCNADFDAMQPCAGGKFCAQCQKTVFDFRESDIEYYEKILAENHYQVCGIFKSSQIQKNTLLLHKWQKMCVKILFFLGFNTLAQSIYAQNNIAVDSTHKESKASESNWLGTIAEQRPQYKYGGDKGFLKFIEDNKRYPTRDCIEGRVFVGCTINKDGSVSDVKILRGFHPLYDAEAMRLVKLLEYVPAMQSGKPISVKYTILIRF